VRTASFLLGGAPFFCNRAGAAEGPIRNETRNKLKNKVGAIAMARTSDIDSLLAFINTEDNPSLNHGGRTSAPAGRTGRHSQGRSDRLITAGAVFG
jgi:cyclophilin family peptidyl-prolyl cis-trans isomerase